MCGIHGIVTINKQPKQKLQYKVDRMLEKTKYRGPDQTDTLVTDHSALGMNRLAIVAPNENATIQFSQHNKMYALFNGEIVNHQEVRKKLKNPPLNQHSDTSIILPLFHEYGQKFIQYLAGMFAIAIYNEHDHSLQLWRDPLGIKPLYYYDTKDTVIFSSEIKAIYAVMDVPPEPAFSALDHELRYRFHPGRDSTFPEIKRALPGETVIFQNGKISRSAYWSLSPNPKYLDKSITLDDFREVFSKIIDEQAQSDVKSGFFVSGGLDSSLVTAMALKQKSSYTVPISIRFSPTSVEDEQYGELLEKTLHTPFEWVMISDETARQTLIELSAFLDEPLENPIHIGTYLMAKRAKEVGVKSVLTGDGSDEFFLGYDRHVCWFENHKVPPSVEYPTWLWALTPDDAKRLYRNDARAMQKPMIDALGKTIEPFQSVDQMLQYERFDRLSEYHNNRLDRMTMAHGVEAKVPFLDHRLVEYALKIPHADLFGTDGKKWLRDAAVPWLPQEIIHRKKVHFPSLADQWTAGNGADWSSEILLDSGAHIRKWIRQDVLETYIQKHKSGTVKKGRQIWALLVLELWLQNLSRWRS